MCNDIILFYWCMEILIYFLYFDVLIILNDLLVYISLVYNYICKYLRIDNNKCKLDKGIRVDVFCLW